MEQVASDHRIELQDDPTPERNIFIRSDQYSFIKKGIPALFLAFGSVPGSKEEAIHTKWFEERYHSPSDDPNQPVDKQAAAQFNRIMAALTLRIANAPERPRWKPDSFFRRFAESE